MVNAFWDASLLELRRIGGLGQNVNFIYQDLVIIRAEEEYILIREVIIGTTVTAASTGSPTPDIKDEKEQAAKEENQKYNEGAGKINITGPNVTLDTSGNPVGPQYDLTPDGALNVTVLIYDNHGGIATNFLKVGLGAKGVNFTATSSEQVLNQLLNSYDELWIIPCVSDL